MLFIFCKDISCLTLHCCDGHKINYQSCAKFWAKYYTEVQTNWMYFFDKKDILLDM